MFTSDEISQRTSPGFSYGFGPMGSPQWRADAGFAGLTPWGPGASDAVVGTAAGVTNTIATGASFAGMGAAAAGWGMKKLGFAVPGMISKTAMLGGFGMGALPGMAVGFAPQMIGTAASAIGNQIETNNIVMQSLGNRVGLGGPGGLGPSRAGLQQIGEATRELAKIPGLMTEVEELNSIMKKMTQAGMMQGARNISDFRQKFTQSINMLKDMSMVLGSTLEEAAGVAAELHKMGIVGAKDKLRLATGIQVSSMVGTGMAPELISQTVGSSLQMAQAMGGKSRIAASQGTLQTIQSMTIANQMGLIDEQKVADLTGFTGEQGIASLAAMTQQKISGMMMNSGLGQAMTAAMSEVKDGKFTGKLDAELVERFKAGAISKEELAKLGSQKLSGKDAGASFVRKRGSLSFNAAQAIGFEGVLNQIGSMVDEVGQGNEDLVALVAKNFLDGDQGLADVLLKMSAERRDISLKSKDELRRGLEAKMSAAIYKRDNTISGKFAKFAHNIGSAYGAPIANAATGFQYRMSESLDAASRFITGASETITVSDFAAQSAQLNMGTTPIELNPQQLAMATGKSLQALPAKVQQHLREKFADPATRARLSREFSKLTTQKEKEDFMRDALGLTGATAEAASAAFVAGAVTPVPVPGLSLLSAVGTAAFQESFAFGRRFKYGIGSEDDARLVMGGAAEVISEGAPDNALTEFSPLMSGEALSNETRDSLAASLQETLGTAFGSEVEAFVKTGGESARFYLTVLSNGGKLPNGMSVEEFNSKTARMKKLILSKQAGFSLKEDEIDDLINRLGTAEFAFGSRESIPGILGLGPSDTAKVNAGKLLQDEQARARALLEEDFQLLQYELGGDTAEAKAVAAFSGGKSAALMGILTGKGKLTNKTLQRARDSLEALKVKSGGLASVTDEEEFLSKLGVDKNLPGISDIISDADTTLSESERSALMGKINTMAVAGAINSKRSNEGLSGDQLLVARDETMLKMVQANTLFVNTVANVIGNDKLKDAANRVSLSTDQPLSGGGGNK